MERKSTPRAVLESRLGTARHGGQPDDHRAGEAGGRQPTPPISAPARGAIVSRAGQPAAAVASTACRTSWVAASGWDTNETCEAGTSTIVAFARSAMNRWSAGGIALSWVPSRYQHGSVCHAGGADGVAANAAAA